MYASSTLPPPAFFSSIVLFTASIFLSTATFAFCCCLSRQWLKLYLILFSDLTAWETIADDQYLIFLIVSISKIDVC
ncbi:hypothetical protein KSP40_PGU008900 [Platanthera guangdongensis]|uniref:Uncharacterized protein n=1 Tax=Platanthera guangdongensis TaxID=2320717 RepID=A0ABR2MWM7_9ASPA